MSRSSRRIRDDTPAATTTNMMSAVTEAKQTAAVANGPGLKAR
jgi:hypothetical protein